MNNMPSASRCVLLLLLLLSALAVCEGVPVVLTTVGSNATLPCQYDVLEYGVVSMCWGSGSLPLRECGNLLVSSMGPVESRTPGPASRYRLLGDLAKGRVAMTILNVSLADAGTYGCRLDVPGWFNDLKYYVELRVQEGERSTSGVNMWSPAPELATEPFPSRTEEENITSTEPSGPEWFQNRSSAAAAGDGVPSSGSNLAFTQEEDDSTPLVLMLCALVVALVALGGAAVYLIQKYVKCRKSSQIVSLSSLRDHSTEVNVYQMDEVNVYQMDEVNVYQMDEVNVSQYRP